MSVYDEIKAERVYQDAKWGHYADDNVNEPNDWVSYIASYSTKWFPGGFVPYNTETVDAFRKGMVKVAALAVGAVESLDRQREAGAAFYEKEVHGDE